MSSSDARGPRGKFPREMVEKGYRFVKVIGSGAFGCAMLVARDSPPGPSLSDPVSPQLFVAKEIYTEGMSQAERSRALQEVKILSSLNHPNIVAFEDAFTLPDRVLIVMEYCPDGDLFSLVQYLRKSGQYLSERQVMSYFSQISLGLKHMHDLRVLHRDLKTCNVFLTDGKRIAKIGDFGISTVLRNTMAVAQTICGTPNYFSPEMCRGHAYSSKSDVWSLGCVLYELCTGRLAFEGSSVHAIMLDIVAARYPPLPSLYSQSIISLLKKLFCPNPSIRPSVNALLRISFVATAVGDLQKALSERQHALAAAAAAAASTGSGCGAAAPEAAPAVASATPAVLPTATQTTPTAPKGHARSVPAALLGVDHSASGVFTRATCSSVGRTNLDDVDALLSELQDLGKPLAHPPVGGVRSRPESAVGADRGNNDPVMRPKPHHHGVEVGGQTPRTGSTNDASRLISVAHQQMAQLEGENEFDDSADAVSRLLADMMAAVSPHDEAQTHGSVRRERTGSFETKAALPREAGLSDSVMMAIIDQELKDDDF